MDQVASDKLLGAVYGYVLTKLFSNKYSNGRFRYTRITKFEPNFKNTSEIEELLELFNIFYENASKDSGQIVNIFMSRDSLIPFGGLLADVLSPVESFKGVLPVVSIYTLFNLNNEIKNVFTDIDFLVRIKRFSDEVVYGSFSLFLILKKLLQGNHTEKESVLSYLKEQIFLELQGLSNYHDTFYDTISDKDMYKISDGFVWNSLLVAYSVLKSVNNYLDGVRKIILAGGQIDCNLELFGLFYGSLYGIDFIPSVYITKIDENIPAMALFKKYILNKDA